MVLGFFATPTPPAWQTDGSLAVVARQYNGGGALWEYQTVGTASYTSAQSSIAASLGSANGYPWGFIVLALAGSAVTPPSPTGTIAITEATDIFASIGYSGSPGVWGSWASTEAKDVFAGTGYTPIFGTLAFTEKRDQFSAYGTLPVIGTMVIGEHPDTIAAVGIGWGVDGTWVSTEATDIFAAAGYPPIYGTFNITEVPDRFQALSAGVTQVRRRRSFFVT
jgi:hypothetical protein